MKRVIFTFVWFLMFLLLSVIALGIIIGDPASGGTAGFEAGRSSGHNYGGLMILGSLVAAIAGSYFRLLPGTRQKA